MVLSTSVLKTPSNKPQSNLRQILNCKNFGIYVAQCRICEKQYVGQTMNSISTRWNSNRLFWKKSDSNDRISAILKNSACFSKEASAFPPVETSNVRYYVKYFVEMIYNGQDFTFFIYCSNCLSCIMDSQFSLFSKCFNIYPIFFLSVANHVESSPENIGI